MSTLLVFPPIVTTGFGSYYPSLAVLAGHLGAAGLAVDQLDLNQKVACHLLEISTLAAIGAGQIPGLPGTSAPGAMAAMAARLLGKNRSQLIDQHGRLASLEGTLGQGYLLPLVCKSLLVDEEIDAVLLRVDGDCPVAHWYRRFYADSRIVESLYDPALRLIGVSVPMGPQLLPALLLAQFIKHTRPDLKIIMGGATFSLMADHDLDQLLLGSPAVDAVVRFEGESALLSLVRQAEARQWAPRGVANVSFQADGVVEHCPPQAAAKLDLLAFADYASDIVQALQEPELGIVQTRGCYWGRCAYCDFVELYDGSPRYRTRSADSFVAEVEHHIQRSGVRNFSLITEAIPPSFARRFAELVVEKDLGIRWNSFAMVDRHFTDQHFRLMKRSGCDSLVIGLETMVDRVLELVGKYAKSSDNAFFIRSASANGIALKVNLIPNLPSTTYREALDALDAMQALADCIDTVTVFPFEATRSSQIGRNPGKYGLIPLKLTNSSGQALFAANHLAVEDPGMNLEQRDDVVRRYQQFADHVNARKFIASAKWDLLSGAAGRLRFAEEDVDLLNEAGELHLFNARTREQWRAPAFVGPLIAALSASGASIDGATLQAAAAKHPEMRPYIQGLIDTGVFVPVAS